MIPVGIENWLTMLYVGEEWRIFTLIMVPQLGLLIAIHLVSLSASLAANSICVSKSAFSSLGWLSNFVLKREMVCNWVWKIWSLGIWSFLKNVHPGWGGGGLFFYTWLGWFVFFSWEYNLHPLPTSKKWCPWVGGGGSFCLHMVGMDWFLFMRI